MSPVNPRRENTAGFRLAVLVEGGLGIVAVLLAWLFSMSLREQFAATASQALWAAARGVVATLPLLAGFWWLVHARWPSTQQLREQVSQMVNEVFGGAPLVQLAFVAGLAGVSEELLFRGVLQTLVGALDDAARWARCRQSDIRRAACDVAVVFRSGDVGGRLPRLAAAAIRRSPRTHDRARPVRFHCACVLVPGDRARGFAHSIGGP